MSLKYVSNIPIKIVHTEKFKTVTVSAFFKCSIDQKRVAVRNLLSKMMIKKTERFNTEVKLLNHLAKFYGAHLSSSTIKRGSDHVVQLRLEFVNDRFILEDLNIFDEMVEVFKDIIQSPSAYDSNSLEYFEKEKRLYVNRLKSIQDNRAQKSYEEMLNVMFEGENARIPGHGTLEDAKNITFEDCLEEHKRMMNHDEISFVVVGNVDDSVIKKFSDVIERENKVVLTRNTFDSKEVLETKQSRSEMNIEQAKLNIGFRVHLNDKTDRINFAALNQMFGGSINSLLFTNVREKMSLAYHISSSVDNRNGYLFVTAGVDHDAVKIAEEAVLKELNTLASGDFEASFVDEIVQLMIVNRLEAEDKPKGLLSIEYSKMIAEKTIPYEALIKEVSKERIVELAQRLQHDTTHVMTRGDSNEN